jgi:hypothetical protein
MLAKFKIITLFIIILFLGAAFRLIGNNWDQGQHLHPDERFLTMVAGNMQWPKSLAEYFDTNTSKLNPHNITYNFYVYGTWPVILVKAVSQTLKLDDYGNLTLVGRAMSGITDLITAIFVFLIGWEISKKTIGGLAAFFFYQIAVLPVQLSHFFAVDPYAVLFATISLYLMLKNRFGILMGIAFGMTLATKISGIMLLPVLGLSYLISLVKSPPKLRLVNILWIPVLLISLYLTLRIAYPYLFMPGLFPALNPKVLANWKELASFNDPNTYYPPGVQWISTQPLIFPLLNLFYFGLGIPFGILSFLGLFYGLLFKRTQQTIMLSLAVFIIFFYQGTQFVKALRYFYLIYPLLAVFAGIFISEIWNYKKIRFVVVGLIALCLVWPVAVMSVYLHPHSRVSASEWIYRNIPDGAIVSGESWDDFLPISLEGGRITERFPKVEIPVTGPDSPEKSALITSRLSQTDYVILSSNRGYGSMTSIPGRYPATSKYYHDLFSGRLNFTRVAEFTSRPHIPIPLISVCIRFPFLSYGIVSDDKSCPDPGITFIDDYADETWTIYDHPKVTIFRKTPEGIYNR